jgi:hypothetical protein
VKTLLEPPSFRGETKNDLAESAPIELTVGIEHPLPEMGNDLSQRFGS